MKEGPTLRWYIAVAVGWVLILAYHAGWLFILDGVPKG